MVDRRLGDNEDFAEFVKKAHDLDIKVVVDGVFNHTGREFLPSGIFRKTGKVLLTAAGIRESTSAGTILIMTVSAMKPGETALNWLT